MLTMEILKILVVIVHSPKKNNTLQFRDPEIFGLKPGQAYPHRIKI